MLARGHKINGFYRYMQRAWKPSYSKIELVLDRSPGAKNQMGAEIYGESR